MFTNLSGNKRKRTGDKKTEKEFAGGFIHGITSNNASSLRSMSYPVLLMDEIDGFKMEVGKEGDPIELAKNRTLQPYEDTAKILYLSTPTILQISKIYELF